MLILVASVLSKTIKTSAGEGWALESSPSLVQTGHKAVLLQSLDCLYHKVDKMDLHQCWADPTADTRPVQAPKLHLPSLQNARLLHMWYAINA